MQLQEMIQAVNERCDDVVDTTECTRWLNYGKNQMAIAIGATFPDLDSNNLEDTFVFDSQFHEGPILYACSVYKEADSALSEVQNFMVKFENLKKEFVRVYTVPPQYRNDRISQQFVATAGQTTFSITKDGYNSSYGGLQVYVNNIETSNFVVNNDNSFSFLSGTTINDGDAITAVWQEHADLTNAPYSWWEKMGW